MGPRNLPLDQQTLTRLLSALTPAETELFDDLMDALVNVITNDLLTEEMSEGHRPTEPTPAEIDLMTNTWEDLFQNPFEYMLHSLESCPNCGRMIALSRMAPHIVSGCGKTTRTDGKKKRRKDGGGGGEGPPVRQTRSAAAVPTKKIPHTSALHTDGLFTSSSSSSQDGPPASQDSIQSAPVVAEFKPDPKRMSGLEHEIVRLKRRASTEGGPAVTTHPQLTGGSGVEISPETPSTSRLWMFSLPFFRPRPEHDSFLRPSHRPGGILFSHLVEWGGMAWNGVEWGGMGCKVGGGGGGFFLVGSDLLEIYFSGEKRRGFSFFLISFWTGSCDGMYFPRFYMVLLGLFVRTGSFFCHVARLLLLIN